MFYGWWVVATAALGLCLGAGPIVVFSFGVFFKPLSQEYHAGRAAVSLAFSIQNLVAAGFAPLIGRLIDRLGPQRVVVPGTAVFGLILVSSKILGPQIGYLYLFFVALGILQGCTSPLSYSVVVSHWFNSRRGLALGLMMLGMGVGAIIVPLVVQRIIAVYGWRMAYFVFGCAALLISVPAAAGFLKGDPQEMGLWPDGITPPDGTLEAKSAVIEEGLSWHDTMAQFGL